MNNSAKNYNFLLVDDDADFRMMAGIWLRAAGYIVEEAQDGEEALAIIKDHSFDLLLLDIDMPKMTGMELASQLNTLGNKVPIFIISSRSNEEYKSQAKTFGVKKYMVKPVEPEILLQNIASELLI